MQKKLSAADKIKELFLVKEAEVEMESHHREALTLVTRFQSLLTKEEYLFLTEYINEAFYNFNILAETYKNQIVKRKSPKIKEGN